MSHTVNLEVFREGEGDQEICFYLEVEVDIYPGQVGNSSGHPDTWTEDIDDEFEIISVKTEDGIEWDSSDLSEDEKEEAYELVQRQFMNDQLIGRRHQMSKLIIIGCLWGGILGSIFGFAVQFWSINGY